MEKFTITTSVPGFLIDFLDQEKVRSRGEVVSKLLKEKKEDLEGLYANKTVKDLPLRLPYKDINELESIASRYKTTVGRVVKDLILLAYMEKKYGENAKK